MPKRQDAVAPPTLKGEWDVRFGTSEAAASWEELGRQLPGNVRAAWDRMRTAPVTRSDTQKPLAGALGTRLVGGRELRQWQIDVSSAGRIIYCVDEDKRRVLVMLASAGHPGATTAKGKRSSSNR